MGCLAIHVRQREGVVITGRSITVGRLQPKLGYAADRRHHRKRPGTRQHDAKSALNCPTMLDQLACQADDHAGAYRRAAEKSERCKGLFRHVRQGAGKRLIFGYSSSDRGARGTNPSRSEE